MNMSQTFEDEGTITVNGTVKWFDSSKGFGFATAPRLDMDILIHRNVLEAAGLGSIAEGSSATLRCLHVDGRLRATDVSNVTPPPRALSSEIDDGAVIHSEAVQARVKWFDSQKGYGFANEFGQSDDIFIGRDALNRSGLQSVETGEAISIQLAELNGQARVHMVHNWVR